MRTNITTGLPFRAINQNNLKPAFLGKEKPLTSKAKGTADTFSRSNPFSTPLLNQISICFPANLSTITKLIEDGEDVNQANHVGDTPLHAAINSPSPGLCQLLIDKGANVNQTDVYGRTPLWYACKLNNSENLETLLTAGADPNQADEDGQVPLMAALWAGNSHQYGKPKIEALLAAGARPDLIQKRDHQCALGLIEESFGNETLQALRQAGAKF